MKRTKPAEFQGLRGSCGKTNFGGSISRVTSLTVRAVVAAVRDQVSCDLAGEAAILHLGSGVYYTLDRVGARVWSLIQQPERVGTLRDTLLTEYDVTPERLEADLFDLLGKLAAERLIEVRDAGAA